MTDPAVVQAVLDVLLPRVETAVTASVDAALARQRTWELVPATVSNVAGPVAELIPDDAPDELVQATRLDDFVGVAGGIAGDRTRTLLVRVPPHGGYAWGSIPDLRPEDPSLDGSEGFFDTDTSTAALANAAVSDMAITTAETAGYLYGIHVATRVTTSATAGNYALTVHRDGAQVGIAWRGPASSLEMCNAIVPVVAYDDAEASQYTVVAACPGVGTLTLTGGAAERRTLAALCLGPARGIPSAG